MAFCNNCGSSLPNNAKFCNKCGSKVVLKSDTPFDDNTYYTNSVDNESTTRSEVYVGTVKKCPYCGEILESKYGNCPSCGHAIQSQRLSSNLVEFVNKVDDCEDKIQRQPRPVVETKGGFSSWSTSIKVLFILSNLFCCFYPLIIYVIWRAIKVATSTPKLTPAEEELTRLIQNFPFPSDQETMTDAILYINSKMDFLSNLDYNEKTPHWAKLWKAKADELYHKATTIYRGNSTINNTYAEICSKFNAIRTEEKKRHKTMIIIIGAAIAGIAIMLIVYLAFFYEAPDYSSYRSTMSTYDYHTSTFDYESYLDGNTTPETTNNVEVTQSQDEASYMATTIGNITYVYPIDWGMSVDGNGRITYVNPDMNINMYVSTSPTDVSVEDEDFDDYIAVFAEDVFSGDYEVSIDRVGGHYAKCAQGAYAGSDDVYAKIYFSDYDEGILIVGFLYTTDQEDSVSTLIRDLLSSFIYAGREEIVYTSTSFGNTNYDVPETWEITEQASDRIVYQSEDGVTMMISYQTGNFSISDDGCVETMESQIIWDELTTEAITLGDTPAYYVSGINNSDGGYACRMYTADCEPGIVTFTFYYYPEYETLYGPQIDRIVSSIDIQG